jgi:hypothetical protein
MYLTGQENSISFAANSAKKQYAVGCLGNR